MLALWLTEGFLIRQITWSRSHMTSVICSRGRVTSLGKPIGYVIMLLIDWLIERKWFRWLAKNMLAKLGFPFMERKFSFISKSCFYEAYVKNTWHPHFINIRGCRIQPLVLVRHNSDRHHIWLLMCLLDNIQPDAACGHLSPCGQDVRDLNDFFHVVWSCINNKLVDSWVLRSLMPLIASMSWEPIRLELDDLWADNKDLDLDKCFGLLECTSEWIVQDIIYVAKG